jgi:hypothetical protein
MCNPQHHGSSCRSQPSFTNNGSAEKIATISPDQKKDRPRAALIDRK